MMMGFGQTSTATSREQIFEALFAKVKDVVFDRPVLEKTTWQGSIRKAVDYSQISAEQMPFLSQFEGPTEKYEQHGNRLPAIRTLQARLFCWARVASGDPNELGTQYITTMLEAVEKALAPEQQGYGFPGLQTLGGLVQWCRIEGTILKFTGDTDQAACAAIPIMILWP